MSKRLICMDLNYIEQLIFAVSFHSLDGIPIGIASSAIGLEICGITPVIKRRKSLFKKKSMIK